MRTDPPKTGRRRTAIGLLITAVLLLLQAASAFAEPYMAIREGYNCADCHTNRTGGGMRNDTVQIHAAEILHLPNDGRGIFPEVDKRFSPRINDYLSVGADFRLVDELLFQDDPDSDGRVKNNTAFRDLESNDIDLEQGNLYAEVRLIPEYLSFYIDQKVAPGGADNREAFGIVDQLLPWDTYIKGGQFYLDWGFQFDDDEAFVSQQTGFTFDNSFAGLELGRGGEGFNWSISATDGSDDSDTDVQVAGNASYMWTGLGFIDTFMLGASTAYDEPKSTRFFASTTYGGVSLGRLALLWQGNLLETKVNSDQTLSWALYGEANYLIAGWLNTKFAFDYIDPDDDTSSDQRNRFSFGFEPFLDEFLQVRLFYRISNGPEDEQKFNKDELQLELHLFF